ncbi:hypothetical protein LAV72_18290 [Lysinibacillus xylanilyticus]|uniref:hypothetical protein n=1 Tax=Lysinibacillus xylanilyticus TaxID=582475 RepID=UPI002B24032A|nr:hypothetical protein [Lysinibacillus xylanilyticus]MEB2301556.1 hypothetical protein [Lysinibacillus xylanilyticus]
MTLSERQLLWYTRIQVFQDGGETSVAKQDVSVVRKDTLNTTTAVSVSDSRIRYFRNFFDCH